jgi:hypothetical protein
LINNVKISAPDFPSPSKFFSAFLCFAAEILAPWQHCLAGHRVLIGKPMKLEKRDTANSKIGATKSKKTLLSGKARHSSNEACPFK